MRVNVADTCAPRVRADACATETAYGERRRRRPLPGASVAGFVVVRQRAVVAYDGVEQLALEPVAVGTVAAVDANTVAAVDIVAVAGGIVALERPSSAPFPTVVVSFDFSLVWAFRHYCEPRGLALDLYLDLSWWGWG